MTPSDPARVAARVTVLPEAGREMCAQWGLNPSAHWNEIDHSSHRLDDAADIDPTAAWDDVDTAERELEELGFILDGGWTAVDTTRGTARQTGFTPGAQDAGMTAHRGVLHPDEYVDSEALRAKVENELGFTYDEVRSVYRQGPLSDAQRELRGRIDARLLEVERAGGEMGLMARAFGWEFGKSGGGERCWTMERALKRARAAEAKAQVAA